MSDENDTETPAPTRPKLGEATVTTTDYTTGGSVSVPLSEYKAGVAAGKYAAGAQATVSQAGANQTESAEQARADLTAGAGAVDTRELAIEDERKAQREALSSWDNKIRTFAEGTIDALSLGLIHQHGDEADLRREVDSGSALLGQLTGTVGGMFVTGPVKMVAGAGEAIGKAAASSLLKSPILARGITEAGVGAALAGAGSVGHQLSDAVIEDKPFSAEAVLHDAGLGAVLGFGGGLAGGWFSSRVGASRAAVRAQGGLFDVESVKSLSVSDHVRDAVAAVDTSIENHAANLGVMRVLADEGEIPTIGDLMEKRAGVLDDARSARARIGDVSEGMSTEDPKKYKAFREAVDDYLGAHAKLDDLMRPRGWEGLKPQNLAEFRPTKVPGFGVGPVDELGSDAVTAMSDRLDEEMSGVKGTDRRAAYEAVQGRGYEPLIKPEPVVEGEGGIGTSATDQGLEDVHAHAGTEEATNPGGKARDISDRRLAALKSNGEDVANTPAWRDALEEQRQVNNAFPERQELPKGGDVNADRARMGLPPLGENVEGAGGRAFQEAGAPPTSGPPQDPGYAAQNRTEFLNPRARASFERPADNAANSPYTNASVSAKRIPPQAAPGNILDSAVGGTGGQELSQFADGYMVKSASLQENAAMFAEFKNRLAEDTAFTTARRAAGVEARAQAPELLAGQGGGAPGGLGDLDKILGTQGDLYGPPEAQNTPGAARYAEKPNARKWILDWYDQTKVHGPTASPGDIAANRITQSVNDIYAVTEGRADAVAALDLGPKYGLKPAGSSLGARMDQVWLLRKAADTVGKAGVAAAGDSTKKAATAMLGPVLGRRVAGKVGALVGMAAAGYAGTVGRVVAATSKLTSAVESAGAKLLAPRVTGAAAASFVAANRPVAYSDKGPIADPKLRILELQRLAANPDAIRDSVAKSAGDAVLHSPTFVQHLQEAAVGTITSLSLKAPHIYFDKFGDPYSPEAQSLRRFLETENTVHDLPRALNAIGQGNATRAQIEAVRDHYPAVAARLIRQALADRHALSEAPPERKRTIDILIGGGLMASPDPSFAMRQIQAWAPEQDQSPNKAQALKMRSETAPTPASSTSPNQP